jgi:hypothetical protein
MLKKYKHLLCKVFRHDYQPLERKTGLQPHICSRCGDETTAFLILPGEAIGIILECKTKDKEA